MPQTQPVKNARRARGFTLIELLVVTVIIAVLVAMLLPSLRQAKEQVSRVHCASQLRQMGVATMGYSVDSLGGFPCTYYAAGIGGNAVPNANSDLTLSDEVSAMGLFMEYAGNDARLLACPSSFGRDGYTLSIPSWQRYLKEWQAIKKSNFRQTTGFFTQKGMQFGYTKYVGADVMFSANADGMRSNPRYSYRRVFNGVNNYRGYMTQNAADNAIVYNTRNSTNQIGAIPAEVPGASPAPTYQDVATNSTRLPSSCLTLWGERMTAMNNGIVGWDHVAHLDPAATPRSMLSNVWTGFNWVTGMNEVMMDGHAEWFSPEYLYANNNSQSYYSVLVQTYGKSR